MQWFLKYHDALRTGGLIVVAMIGIVLACWRNIIAGKQARTADQQAEIAMENHLTDAYTRAIDQLGKKEEAVQLGGLYALEKIADSNEPYYRQIMEVLCAFIRLTAEPVGKEPPAPSERQVKSTVQTALAILGRINLSSVVKIKLVGIKLCYANLPGADLTRAIFFRANLFRADLSDAILIKANLRRANLSMVNLSRAKLSEADFSGADLSGAILIEAKITLEQLQAAKVDMSTILPDHIDPKSLVFEDRLT